MPVTNSTYPSPTVIHIDTVFSAENATDATQTTTSNWTVPENCVPSHFKDLVPLGSEDILTSKQRQLIERLVTAWFLPLVFTVGFPTNVLSMVVFYKLGLKERINVCLFALSLADGLYMLYNMVLNAERMYTQFTTGTSVMFNFIVNSNLIGFAGFSWMSQIMSAIIASERCLCILSPLHSQNILKTRTTAIFISVCFVVGMCFLVATRYRVICLYNPLTNMMKKTAGSSNFYYQNQELVNALDSVVYGALIPGTAIFTVIITTIITAVKLNQAVARRAEMSTSKIFPREAALTKMLIYNSVLFIVCVSPVALFRFTLFLVPELNAGRRYSNLFVACLIMVDALTYTNSSFHFFIYYSMGSRYRATVKMIFSRKRDSYIKEQSGKDTCISESIDTVYINTVNTVQMTRKTPSMKDTVKQHKRRNIHEMNNDKTVYPV